MSATKTTPQTNGTAEIVDAASTELIPVEASPSSLFRTTDPVEIVEEATKVANALKAVIVAQRLYANIQRKSYVLVEGWQMCGVMLGVTAVCTKTEPVDGGFKATVEARRLSDGQVIGRAEALCTKHEVRGPWKTADDYARLSMAQTRATSKSLKGPLGFIIALAGYETTPAEEAEGIEGRSATPAADAHTDEAPITKKRAADLVERALAVGVNSAQLSMQLIVFEVEHDEIRNKGTAKAAVARCTVEQADQLEAWISECADKLAAEAK